MRRIAGVVAVVAVAALVGCGSGSENGTSTTFPIKQELGLPTTITTGRSTTITTGPSAASPAYARALMQVRRQFMFQPGADYAKAAEALNLITPPAGFALRHAELVKELLMVASLETLSRSDPVRVGSAQGLVDAHLTNLAREADPSVPY